MDHYLIYLFASYTKTYLIASLLYVLTQHHSGLTIRKIPCVMTTNNQYSILHIISCIQLSFEFYWNWFVSDILIQNSLVLLNICFRSVKSCGPQIGYCCLVRIIYLYESHVNIDHLRYKIYDTPSPKPIANQAFAFT